MLSLKAEWMEVKAHLANKSRSGSSFHEFAFYPVFYFVEYVWAWIAWYLSESLNFSFDYKHRASEDLKKKT